MVAYFSSGIFPQSELLTWRMVFSTSCSLGAVDLNKLETIKEIKAAAAAKAKAKAKAKTKAKAKPTAQPAAAASGDPKKKGICIEFLTGSCKNNNCPMSHVGSKREMSLAASKEKSEKQNKERKEKLRKERAEAGK